MKENSNIESEMLIGKILDQRRALEDLRTNIGVDTVFSYQMAQILDLVGNYLTPNN